MDNIVPVFDPSLPVEEQGAGNDMYMKAKDACMRKDTKLNSDKLEVNTIENSTNEVGVSPKSKYKQHTESKSSR